LVGWLVSVWIFRFSHIHRLPVVYRFSHTVFACLVLEHSRVGASLQHLLRVYLLLFSCSWLVGVGWCAVTGDGLTMARTAGVSRTILRFIAFFSPALILKGNYFPEKRKTKNPGLPTFPKSIFFLTRFHVTVQSERSEGQQMQTPHKSR
jgi:hypothetical protein